MKTQEPIKVLVLSGGGAHTITYIGLWEYIYKKSLADDRYIPQYIIGTSGGALFGVFMAARKSPQEIINELIASELHKIFSVPSAVRAATFLSSWGMIDIEKIIKRLREILDKHEITWDSFKETRYCCVTADLTTGHREYLTDDRGFLLEEAIAASIAIPGVFTPVWRYIDGSDIKHCFVDGGVCEALPVKAVFALGFDNFKTLAFTPFVITEPRIHDIHKMKDYFQMIFHTLHDSKISDMESLMEADEHESLLIATGYQSKNMLDFSDKSIQNNFELGKEIARKHKREIDRFFTGR